MAKQQIKGFVDRDKLTNKQVIPEQTAVLDGMATSYQDHIYTKLV